MTEERRQYDRVVFKIGAELAVQGKSCHTDRISNLSLGGCLLPITEDVTPGAPCVVTIKMGGNSSELTIRLSGEILRSNEKGLAVRFINLEPDSLLHLQSIVRHNLPYSHDAAKEFQFKRWLLQVSGMLSVHRYPCAIDRTIVNVFSMLTVLKPSLRAPAKQSQGIAASLRSSQ